MRAELVIWGAGGHGKVVFDAALAMGYTGIVFVDDRANGELFGCVIVASSSDIQTGGERMQFIVAIGDNRARADCYSRGLQQGWTPVTVIHPSAVVSPYSEISPGCAILPRAVINAGTVIAPNCIINTGAIVEHDCRIDDHVHISPSATLGGNVQVGALAHVGIGASVLPGASIGAASVIGAGAVVLASIPEAATAVGVPARILSRPRPSAQAGGA